MKTTIIEIGSADKKIFVSNQIWQLYKNQKLLTHDLRTEFSTKRTHL